MITLPPILRIHATSTTIKTVFDSLVSHQNQIQTIATAIFKGCTNICLCGFGALELKHNFKKDALPEKLNSTQDKIKSSSNHLNLHGSLLVGSGTFGFLDALQEFGLVNFQNFGMAISFTSGLLFLSANIIGAQENIRLLDELMNNDWSKTNITDEELKWAKQSAFWGLLSNLGYCLMTASLLYSWGTAVTMVIATISCCAGGIKIVFDAMNWAKTVST